MSSKIPSSLKWLIKKRARLMGEIAKAEKNLQEACRLKEKRLEVLRSDLNVIDQTIRLHDLPIDPECIRPIRGQTRGRISPYGHLTSSILAIVRASHPNPITTTEIAITIGARFGILHNSPEFSPLRLSVGDRLRKMRGDGWISRLHEAQTNMEGRWLLGERAFLKSNQVRQ